MIIIILIIIQYMAKTKLPNENSSLIEAEEDKNHDIKK